MAEDTTRFEGQAERLERLRQEVTAALQARDLATDEERGDGHHHPAEAATDAEARERELRQQLSAVLRWTADFGPKFPPYIDGIEWLAAPWPAVNYPDESWSVFASGPGDGPAVGNPGVGDWAITPSVHFAGLVAMLQAPVRVPVAQITAVQWAQHPYEDGVQNFVAGTNRVFPESFETPQDGVPTVVRDLVDVEVQVNWPASAGTSTTVYLRSFDPDHPSSDTAFDVNDATQANAPEDNVMAGGGAAPNGGGHLTPQETLTVPANATSGRVSFHVSSPQPGNNFVVVASGREEYLDQLQFGADGVTLVRQQSGNIPSSVHTPVLTVWRTLHVELDSMAAPAADPDPNEFPGAGQGAGAFQDDEYPGDVGAANNGDFAMPSLAFLTSEFERGNVAVQADILDGPDDPDQQDDIAFVHNLGDAAYGAAVIDVPYNTSFWTVQVFAAYEGPSDVDFDPNAGTARMGQSINHTVTIYLETIRDLAANLPGAVDADRLRQRNVLHEVMHQFGYMAHDDAVMNPVICATGPDQDNALTGVMLRKLHVK